MSATGVARSQRRRVTMAEFLLELLSEEIPARMQTRAAEDLKRLVTDGLKAAGLSFTDARAFATPRRLALVVDGLPAAAILARRRMMYCWRRLANARR